MPVIFHESKKRMGNAGKDRALNRIPPTNIWPGLDQNGKPMEVEETSQELARVNEDVLPNFPVTGPPTRSRKRKKQASAVWKEIMDPPNEKLPTDLQAEDSCKRGKTQNDEITPTDITLPLRDVLPLPHFTPAIQIAASAADPSPSVSTPAVVQYLPEMVKGISHIKSMLEKLVSSHTQLSETQGKQSQLLKKHEDVLSRVESMTSRQETQLIERLLDLQKRIQELQQEARQRDAIITELQKGQQQERKESCNRITEALQKIEYLQTQNEKLQRLTATDDERAPRKVSDITFLRKDNMKRQVRNVRSDSSESSDGFGIPTRGGQRNRPLNDSPSSTGSWSSTKAISRRKRIIPGLSLLRPNSNARTQSIRDLIPNYALDSLARGRSTSSTS